MLKLFLPRLPTRRLFSTYLARSGPALGDACLTLDWEPCVHASLGSLDLPTDDGWKSEVQHAHSSSNLSLSRFDWRLRAASRARTLKPSKNPFTKGQYLKRTTAAMRDVGMGEHFFDEIQAYQSRFMPLLEAEQEEEEDVLKTRLSNWSTKRLEKEGYCLSQMSAFWLEANQYGRPVAVFSLGPGIALPQHRFENGIQVLVSRVDPLKEEPIRGSILSSTETELMVSFEQRFEVTYGEWRLDVGSSNMGYLRMCEAVKSFNLDPAEQEMESAFTDHQVVLQGTYLRDILLRSFSPSLAQSHDHVPLQAADEVAYPGPATLEHGARTQGEHSGAFSGDMLVRSWAKRYSQLPPVQVEGDPVLDGLNASQVRAIAMMIGERFSLIQGPPGTGKTRTIIETIKLLKVHFEVPHPLLVCTFTNVAVDNLVEGLAAAGVKPLRVGFGGKVRKSLEPFTIAYRRERHPKAGAAAKAEKEVEELSKLVEDNRRRTVELGKTGTPAALRNLEVAQRALATRERRLQAVKAKSYAIEQGILRDIVKDADVICTTCITSASAAMKVTDFPVVFLDEASMSTEPASLIPLMKGSQHVALIGDHKQLPPVITSSEAQANGLGISLFERLTEEGEVPSVMLNVQYRMHPAIARFPASEFYNNMLLDGMVDAAGGVPSRLNPPASTQLNAHADAESRPSVIFLDHGGNESAKDKSRVNWNEAHIVCSVIEDLLLNNEHLCGKDIGVIAPYAAQISLLTRLLNTDKAYLERFRVVLGQHRAMQMGAIEVKTVDGFEGREKEVIIFSTVRNNPDGHIGFLADRRRLNVGLTRAKRGLFVVGSLSTLRAGKISGAEARGNVRVGKGGEAWQRYAQFLTDERLVMRLTGERLAKALYGNLPLEFRDRYLGSSSQYRL